MSPKQSLTIPGRYSAVRLACEFIAEAARRAGFDDQSVFQVELACDEACTNVIDHAYGGEGPGELTLSHEVSAGQFVVTIVDHGRSFEPDLIPPPVPPRPDATDELRVGGLGLHLMYQAMDEVSFTFEDSSNTLVMSKRLPDQEGTA